MLSNKRGAALIAVIIWIIIIGAAVFYAPRLYRWYVEQNEIRIIKSNVESVENEIKSELLRKHPVIIWNDIDNLFKILSIQNPMTRAAQTENGWSTSGDVIVGFDGEATFTIDGIGPDGSMLHLNIMIRQ
jgi:uncharacterized membrane protein